MVADCCDPRGYDKEFGDKFARQMERKYRHGGLDDTAAWMVDYFSRDGLEGARVLEIGGGVGEIGIELARRGAAHVTTLELSVAYDPAARRLAAEAGVADKLERRIFDIAAQDPEQPASDLVPPAEIVVLHRVVCCYPDFERLLGAAGGLCRGKLAFSHPPRHWGTRLFVATSNAGRAARRRDYRAFAHPPEAMVGVLEALGLRQQDHRRGLVWQAEALSR